MIIKITFSLLSGVLLALCLEPFNFWFFGFITFLPFLFALNKSKSPKSHLLMGFFLALLPMASTLYPLTSAGVWTGWVDFAKVDYQSYVGTQTIVLSILWIGLSFYGALLGSVFALMLLLGKNAPRPLFYLFYVPACWIVFVEQIRDWSAWGYNWVPLSSLLLEIPSLSQILSVGGSSFGTFFVIVTNTTIFLLLTSPGIPKKASLLFSLVLCLAVAVFWGKKQMAHYELTSLNDDQAFELAIVQYSEPPVGELAYTDFAMNSNYLKFTEQIFAQYGETLDLVVLPESIGFGAISLDNTKSASTPDKTVSKIDDWGRSLGQVMGQSPAILVLGADTVRKEQDYNTLLAFNRNGPVYSYNKTMLVPFAEARIGWLSKLGLSGRSSYQAGNKLGVMQSNRANIGFFICQEVLYPNLIRELVEGGADLLITIGNDGVFTNETATRINHKAARMRAIEARKYLIRSMKSGISAVIKPSGLMRSAAGVNENSVLFSKVYKSPNKSVFSSTYVFWKYIWVIIIISVLSIYRFKKS